MLVPKGRVVGTSFIYSWENIQAPGVKRDQELGGLEKAGFKKAPCPPRKSPKVCRRKGLMARLGLGRGSADSFLTERRGAGSAHVRTCGGRWLRTGRWVPGSN